ncbi:hypothetical protein ACHAPY_011639 [Fusarium culmorum]
MAIVNGHQKAGQGNKCRDTPIHANRHLRVICIGSGASGLHLMYKMKREFTNVSLDVYEKNPDVSGTWYENRYPGCACDTPAHNYVYSFEPNTSCRFAVKYDLRKYIKTQHEVVGATWVEERACWVVSIRRPDNTILNQECDWLISGAGILNAWRWPAIPGIDKYQGQLLHSDAWDQSVDVAGKHVGLIGNGSSGIQILPKMQEKADHVTTFIREATWISATPGMEYRKYTDEEREEFVLHPDKLTELRKASEKAIGEIFPVVFDGSAAQKQLEGFIKDRMIEKLNNKDLERLLIPDFAFDCRRITPGTAYLESLTKPNVTTIYGEIKEITETGCVTADGKEYPTDVLICATGFDTSFRPRFPLIGREGRDLAREWELEPRSYLGLATSGFPNYFMYLGPNYPIANGPIIFSIELQTDHMDPNTYKIIPNFDKHDTAGLYRGLATSIYKTRDGRYFHLHGSLNIDPTLTALGLPIRDPSITQFDAAVARIQGKVEQFDSADIDHLMNEKYKQAGCIPLTKEEYFSSESGKANYDAGFYEMTKWPEQESKPSSALRPLAGLKVVDLSRIIAAPAISRSLAEMGASVMRVTGPDLADLSAVHHDMNWGKWNSHLDLKKAGYKEKLWALISEADVIVDGYRPGVLEKHGFGRDAVFEAIRVRGRGIIYVRENCYGWHGPWVHRSGWQQISDACCGISMGFGRAMGLEEPITPIFPNADFWYAHGPFHVLLMDKGYG